MKGIAVALCAIASIACSPGGGGGNGIDVVQDGKLVPIVNLSGTGGDQAGPGAAAMLRPADGIVVAGNSLIVADSANYKFAGSRSRPNIPSPRSSEAVGPVSTSARAPIRGSSIRAVSRSRETRS